MTFRLRFAVVLSLLAVAPPVYAQAPADVAGYPNRPVHVIVPFPAGGGIDLTMRVISQELGNALGQPVIIDNRGGAGGVVGVGAGARAPADGYTLTASTAGPLSIGSALNAKLPYNPVSDFAPIAMLAIGANVLVVAPSSPVRSVADLIALAKASPKELIFGSSGVGTSPHLSAELLRYLTGIKFVHVPYKGTGAVLADVMGGRLDFSFADISVLPLVKSGQLRALAVTTPKRYVAAPDLPTVAEAGVPGFEATSWYCLLAPATTPKGIIARLNREVVGILNKPEIRATLLQQNIEAVPSTPDELGRYLREDIARWTAVANAAGLKLE